MQSTCKTSSLAGVSTVGWVLIVKAVQKNISKKLLRLGFRLKSPRLRVDKGLGRVWGVGSLGLTVYAMPWAYRACM